MLRRFTTAVAFLTRIPVNPAIAHDGRDVARASVFFPLVGCLLVLIQLVVLEGLSLMSLPYVLQAIFATVVLMLVGGGLHQDGLADMADGFGGAFTKDKVLHIMKDSTIGTYGALALLLSLATRIASLTSLIAVEGGWAWMFVAAVVSRCSIGLAWAMPYARDVGTAQSLTQLTGKNEVIGALLSATLIALMCVGWHAFYAFLLAGILFAVMARLCHQKIGGVTGDTLGATTEVSEVMILALGVSMVRV